MTHDHLGSRGHQAVFRRLVLIAAFALGAFATCAWGEELPAAEKAFLDRHFSDVIKIEPVRLNDPAVAKAFATPLYRLDITIDSGNGGSLNNSVIVAHQEDKLVSIGRPGSNQDCLIIQGFFRPDFRLKDDDDARVLQAAFDAIYPISSDDDRKVATFKHAGDQWTFVRGEFFDHLMGFVVTTDSDNAVTRVQYVLKLP